MENNVCQLSSPDDRHEEKAWATVLARAPLSSPGRYPGTFCPGEVCRIYLPAQSFSRQNGVVDTGDISVSSPLFHRGCWSAAQVDGKANILNHAKELQQQVVLIMSRPIGFLSNRFPARPQIPILSSANKQHSLNMINLLLLFRKRSQTRELAKRQKAKEYTAF